MLPSHHLTLTSILLPSYFHPCPRSDSQRSSRALSAFTPWRRRAYSGDAIWGPYFRSRSAFVPPGIEIAALFRVVVAVFLFFMLPSHHLMLTSILLPSYFHPCPRSDSQRSSRALSAFTPWRRRAYSGDAIWGPYFRSRGAFVPPGVSFGTMPAVVSEIAALC